MFPTPIERTSRTWQVTYQTFLPLALILWLLPLIAVAIFSVKPDADFANRVRAEALNRNLVLLTCGVYGNVVRFLAPITIEDEVFAEGLDILEASIEAAKAA